MKLRLHFFLYAIFCGSISYAQIGFNEHFIATISSNLINTPTDLFVADIDGDGVDDVITVSIDNDNKIAWFKNEDYNGGFESQHVISEGVFDRPITVFAVDIDGDNDLDVITGSSENSSYAWFENNGTGSFDSEHIIPSTRKIFHIISFDVDNDGDNDLISCGRQIGSNNFNDIFWHENVDGLGSFEERPIIIDNGVYFSIVFGDVDDDNFIDIITTRGYINDDIILLSNNNDGTFSESTIYNLDDQSLFVNSLEDIDNDGDLDLFFYGNSKVLWHENNGSGTFTEGQVLDNHDVCAITMMDVDDDGDKDILTNDYLTDNNEPSNIWWIENIDGLGNFNEPQVLIDDINWAKVVNLESGDFNNDGKVDFVRSVKFHENRVMWFDNLGELGNTISGNVSIDYNLDGCDSNDSFLSDILIITDNGTNSFATFTQENGDFQFSTNPGNFSTTISTNFPDYFITTPNSQSTDFVGLGNSDVHDFCVSTDEVVNNLSVSFYPLNEARPGFDAHYQIVYKNNGTTTLSGTVSLEFDASKMSFTSANESPLNQTSGNILFEYFNLEPFEERTINVTFTIEQPPVANNNDQVSFSATINPIVGDYSIGDNGYELKQTLVGSFDPNDIRVLEGAEILIDDIDKYLHYIIRFQNTGTASAINVKVTNDLDDDFDWSSIQIENTSHPNTVQIIDGSFMEFEFNNINLPDSTSNEPASHGYIQYKIKPKPTAALGDLYTNNANIYFDFNEPILTNTVNTLIVDRLSVEDNAFSETFVFPNPTKGILTVENISPISSITIYDQLGKVITIAKSSNTIDLSSLSKGLYFVRIEAVNGNTAIKKVIKQ